MARIESPQPAEDATAEEAFRGAMRVLRRRLAYLGYTEVRLRSVDGTRIEVRAPTKELLDEVSGRLVRPGAVTFNVQAYDAESQTVVLRPLFNGREVSRAVARASGSSWRLELTLTDGAAQSLNQIEPGQSLVVLFDGDDITPYVVDTPSSANVRLSEQRAKELAAYINAGFLPVGVAIEKDGVTD